MGDHNPPAANARPSPRACERGRVLVPERSDSLNVYPEPSYSPRRSTPVYRAPLSSLPQSDRNVPYHGPPNYPSIQSYPPNFQGVPYPTPPQFHYSSGHHSISVPAEYGYEPDRSRSGVSRTYSDSSAPREIRTSAPGPSLPSTSSYTRMTYATPVPYPYSRALSSLPPLAPVYAPRNRFSAPADVPPMDPGQEHRYAGTPASTREGLDLGSYSEQSGHRPRSVRLPDPERPSTATRLKLASASQGTRLGSYPISHTIGSSAQAGQEQRGSFRPHAGTDTHQSYQPHLPVARSEWAMWVGNIPSNCDRDELCRFFDWPPGDSLQQCEDARKETPGSGVVSVFLIPQSNCAFVNYDSEARLLNAVARCNGVAIRPDDPRCIKLVCRVRKRDKDLKAGVGAQRGVGIHTAWVQQQKSKREYFFIRLRLDILI